MEMSIFQMWQEGWSEGQGENLKQIFICPKEGIFPYGVAVIGVSSGEIRAVGAFVEGSVALR